MPDAGFARKPDSSSVVLFADALHPVGSETVFFDTKLAEKFYYMLDYSTDYSPTTTVTITSNSGCVITNEANMGDGDVTTAGTVLCDVNTDVCVIRFDFGSQAIRKPAIFIQNSASGLNTPRISSRWAGSDLVFSSFGSEGFFGTDKELDPLQFGQQDLRYVEIEVDQEISNSRTISIFNMIDQLISGGTVTPNVQIQNTTTGLWNTVNTLTIITPPLNGETATTFDEDNGVEPNKNLTRIELVTTEGEWSGSLTVILVDPVK